MKENSANTVKRIITIVLTVVSCLLLFTNWAVTKGSSKYDWSEYSSGVLEVLEEAEDLAGWFDVKISTKGIRRLAECISDGKLKPVEIVTVGIEGNRLLHQMKKIDILDEEDLSEISSVRYLLILYIILFLLILIIAVRRIITLAKNDTRRINGWGLFAIQVINLIVFIALCVYAKGKHLQLGLTAWPFIACLCAVSFSLIDRIPDRLFASAGDLTTGLATGRDGTKGPALPLGGGWICPDCGGKNDRTGLFCSKCGRKKPEKTVCGNCGVEIDEADAFCRKCGTRVVREKPTVICPSCGVRIPAGSKFCGCCGASLTDQRK